MSASSKKKLRKEQEAEKLTEKQLTAQKEAKQLNLLTIGFVTVLAIILVVAVTVGVKQTLNNTGILQKNTIALTVGDHEINSVEMNYFYVDAVEQFYNNYGAYDTMFGLDVTRPLNEQVINEETGATWADDFYTSAKSTAQSVYAMVDAANAEGFTLSDQELTEIEYSVYNIESYAILYGYADGNAFLQSRYGAGATTESYLNYVKNCTLANAYSAHYAEHLTYDDAALRAVDAGENYRNYNSYAFNSYFLSVSKFLTGGTAGEDGSITYSDDEQAAAQAAAEAACQVLTADDITTPEAFDAAIAGLSVNEGIDAVSTAYPGTLYTSLNENYVEWVSDPARQSGDTAYFASKTSDAEGKETVSGYYVIMFNGCNENTSPMINVRHILVSFAGGTTDPATGATVYTDDEKAAAKSAAEELLAQWKSGEATEASFGELAMGASTDTGSASNGGLIENVYPGQMVANFNDWCFDPSRQAGDTDIVGTEYGYHVMYFVGNSDMSYRDFMISNELRDAAVSEWFNAIVEATPVVDGNTKYIHFDMVLNVG